MMRRSLLAGGLAAAAGPALARGGERVEVWRDPNCGCCSDWVAHLRTAGFVVEDRVVTSVAPFRRMLGTPANLLSCHAGRVGGYALEGHVPAAAVTRLLADRPAEIRGLAVPGMPVGSPGMEIPGQAPDSYDVLAFDAHGGHSVFMRFRGGTPV